MHFLIKLNWDEQKMTATTDAYLGKLTAQLEIDIGPIDRGNRSRSSEQPIASIIQYIEVLKEQLKNVKVEDGDYQQRLKKIITLINLEVSKLHVIEPSMLLIQNQEPVAISLGKTFLAELAQTSSLDSASATPTPTPTATPAKSFVSPTYTMNEFGSLVLDDPRQEIPILQETLKAAAADLESRRVRLDSPLNNENRLLLLQHFHNLISSIEAAIEELNKLQKFSDRINTGNIKQAINGMNKINKLCKVKRNHFNTSKDDTFSDGKRFLEDKVIDLTRVIENNITIPTQPAHVISWGEKFLDFLAKFITFVKTGYKSDETKQQDARRAMDRAKGLLFDGTIETVEASEIPPDPLSIKNI